MTLAPRKFSGEKWPRNRSVGDSFEGKADAGPVEDSGLTMESGYILGRWAPETGEVEPLLVVGPGAELAPGEIRFLGDAQTVLGLGQFADTLSAALRDIIPDSTGEGGLVFSTLPELEGLQLKGESSGKTILTADGDAYGQMTLPSGNDIIATRNLPETLRNKTLRSAALTGPLTTQTENAAAPTIFEVKNTNTGGSSYSIFRLTNGSSTVDMLASHAGTLAQFGGAGAITLFQMVFDTFAWFSLGVAHMMRLTTAGLRIGPTAAPATSMLTVEGSVALGKTQIVTTATATVADDTTHIICNFAGTVTLTLPTAASFPDRVLTIRTITANTVVSNASNVAPRTGGAYGTAILAAAAGNWAALISDGGGGYQNQMGN